MNTVWLEFPQERFTGIDFFVQATILQKYYDSISLVDWAAIVDIDYHYEYLRSK